MSTVTINDLPVELLERILHLATAYLPQISHLYIEPEEEATMWHSNRTRRAIVIVNRMWHDVGLQYLYRDIALFSAKQLRNLLSRVIELASVSSPVIEKIRNLVIHVLWTEASDNTEKPAALHLPVLLSHLTLAYFSTHLDPNLPWLNMLSHKSGLALTVLELEISPSSFSASAIGYLNRFVNLVSLRIGDNARSLGLEFEMTTFSELPGLSLPRLEELFIVHRNRNDDRPLYLGRSAILPSLTKLNIYTDTTSTDAIPALLSGLSSTLRVLSIDSMSNPAIPDNLSTLVPHLTDLTYTPGFAEQPYILRHPELRRLRLAAGKSNLAVDLGQLQRADVPMLESVRFFDIAWKDFQDYLVNDPDECEVSDDMDVINLTVTLARKGIPLLDQEGHLFGGLLPAVVK